MSLNSTNSNPDYKHQICSPLGKCRTIIAHFLWLFLSSYSSLHLSSKIAVAESPTISETKEQICSESLEPHQQVALVASASVEISTWISEPQTRVTALIDTFGADMLTHLDRNGFGESKLDLAMVQIWQEIVLPVLNSGFNFTNPVQLTETTIDQIPLILIKGGKPITIHADSRYQLPELLAKSGTNAIAAVDGTFFSLKYLTSNVIIGPVLSQVNNQFIPGNNSENQKLTGRPLVVISPQAVRYIPFNPAQHNTLEGIQAEMPNLTDAFVAGAWLVKNRQPASKESFNGLYGADVARHRAFWGINQLGQPTIGVSTQPVDSASLGEILVKAGLRDAVMLDSGASTSLAYKGESLVGYVPRPVPHAVALIPPPSMTNFSCLLAAPKTKNGKS
ncbi:MAG: phosphodiester glycosidase family protein [Gloeotrichia echinulata GP01]